MNGSSRLSKYTFSVVIPTYNRAHTLPRLFESIEAQTFKDFEVIVVDNGSTDGTLQVVEEYAATTSFDLHYVFQENTGKAGAENTAARIARGALFKVIDSDDVLTTTCLEIMATAWVTVEADSGCAGVRLLCADMATREVIGDPFPRSMMRANHAEMSSQWAVKGDKTECTRTELVRRFAYPSHRGEIRVPTGYLWHSIGAEHDFLCINKVGALVDYRPDGISANVLEAGMQSPRGSFDSQMVLAAVALPRLQVPLRARIRAEANVARWARHAGYPRKNAKHSGQPRWRFVVASVIGAIVYWSDIARTRKTS